MEITRRYRLRLPTWQGAVGMKLGTRLYVDLSADVDSDAFDAACFSLADAIIGIRRRRRAELREMPAISLRRLTAVEPPLPVHRVSGTI